MSSYIQISNKSTIESGFWPQNQILLRVTKAEQVHSATVELSIPFEDGYLPFPFQSLVVDPTIMYRVTFLFLKNMDLHTHTHTSLSVLTYIDNGRSTEKHYTLIINMINKHLLFSKIFYTSDKAKGKLYSLIYIYLQHSVWWFLRTSQTMFANISSDLLQELYFLPALTVWREKIE